MVAVNFFYNLKFSFTLLVLILFKTIEKVKTFNTLCKIFHSFYRLVDFKV